jgi:hypothetical protein
MVSPDPSITKTLSENKLGRGYRGIWYNLGQDKGYGPKYSGGLGTYPANMVPMAVCDPREERVYFVYGGSKPDNRKDLQIMIGTFDTKTHKLRRPNNS